jgi:hypothetical protein
MAADPCEQFLFALGKPANRIQTTIPQHQANHGKAVPRTGWFQHPTAQRICEGRRRSHLPCFEPESNSSTQLLTKDDKNSRWNCETHLVNDVVGPDTNLAQHDEVIRGFLGHKTQLNQAINRGFP